MGASTSWLRSVDLESALDATSIARIFDSFDKDHSGVLEGSEIKKFVETWSEANRIADSESVFRDLMKKFDSNNDGKLSKEELMGISKASFGSNLIKLPDGVDGIFSNASVSNGALTGTVSQTIFGKALAASGIGSVTIANNQYPVEFPAHATGSPLGILLTRPKKALTSHAAIMASSPGASELIKDLCAQANKLIPGGNYESFDAGGQGSFPYYWESPRNTQFNHLTYDWINHHLHKSDSQTPIPRFDSDTFTTLYIHVFSKVYYDLSKVDHVKLREAEDRAQSEQLNLLNAWKQAYGRLPDSDPNQTPTSIILDIIATTWADPPTDLTTIQKSTNLDRLLNKTPSDAKNVRPALAAYLLAIGASISLQNNVTMNSGYLTKALAAVQEPSSDKKTDNGGMKLDNDLVVPAYDISPKTKDIIRSLEGENKIVVSMTVQRQDATYVSVSVTGGARFSIPIFDFFSLGLSGNASYFSESIAVQSNTVEISMTFPGVTQVNFSPRSFEASTKRDWFWMQPIRDAIQNGSKDISGYHFSPEPGTDFSIKGPFGYVNGLAISQLPIVEVTVISADYKSIETAFQSSATVDVSFLGITLASVTEQTYNKKVSVDTSLSRVSIIMKPPPLSSNIESRAWVLGAQLVYPALREALWASRVQ